MAGYRPAYADNDQQPVNSRHSTGRVQGHRKGEPQRFAEQVDSWRSYKNDTTNLQQAIGRTGISVAPDFRNSVKMPNLNPAATPFQPFHPQVKARAPRNSSAASLPLRVSDRRHKKQEGLPQQVRFNSTTIQAQAGQPYALRSQSHVSQTVAPAHDQPLPSIEQHVPQRSSIPADTRRRADIPNHGGFGPRSASVTAPSPPAPTPTRDYLSQAALTPYKLTFPQKLLVVVDLNGTLLKRGAHSRTSFVLRPGVAIFMDYLFANHAVMIYTSARPENAQGMVNKLFHPRQRKQLVAIWARDKLGLTAAQYKSKVQVYKKLEKIWANNEIQKSAGTGRRWSQSNTVLLDDSHLKALAQPYNLLRVEEFINDRPSEAGSLGKMNIKQHQDAVNTWHTAQMKVLEDLQIKLEDLKWVNDVSQSIYMSQSSSSKVYDSVNDQTMSSDLWTGLDRDGQGSADESEQSDGGAYFGQQPGVMTSLYEVDSHDPGKTRSDQGEDNTDLGNRSVSPIDEAIWRDILGGVEQSSKMS